MSRETMKIVGDKAWVILTVGFALATSAVIATRAGEPKEAGKLNPYLGLRNQALHLSRAAAGLPQPTSVREPWGVLMETGYDEGSVTVFALLDGNASIYLSSGGGSIGGQGHDSIRRTAVAMVREAANHISSMTLTSVFPLPKKNQTVFYALTDSGVYTASALEQTLGEGGNKLSPLFYAGQDVITQYRLVSKVK